MVSGHQRRLYAAQTAHVISVGRLGESSVSQTQTDVEEILPTWRHSRQRRLSSTALAGVSENPSRLGHSVALSSVPRVVGETTKDSLHLLGSESFCDSPE